MLTTEVENYPGFPDGVTGPEMMAMFQKQAERFDTRVVNEDIVGCDFSKRPFTLTTSEDRTVHAHSVVIATGATANWIGLENELRLAQIGGGVSACAVCDGALPLFRKQHLAVVGGGDTAMEEASYLAKFASKVTIVHRRDEWKASAIMLERARKNPKIEWLVHKNLAEVLSEPGKKKVRAVVLEDSRNSERMELAAQGVFIAIGHEPNSALLKGKVELDEQGYVKVEPNSTRTAVEGLFACGDLVDKVYRQAVTAAGSGCMAAIDAERWLETQGE
jgi:thioredoxin reductase (NADPH)